jgi:hypothetical protein
MPDRGSQIYESILKLRDDGGAIRAHQGPNGIGQVISRDNPSLTWPGDPKRTDDRRIIEEVRKNAKEILASTPWFS